MVEVSDTLMAKHLIEEALEVGEFDVPGHIGLGEYGQHDMPLEWDLNNLDPSECTVEMDDETIVVRGDMEATYTVKTASSTRMQPAEYKTERVDLYVSISRDLGDMSAPQVYGEIA